jgi:molybdopterin-guanine dinucleotide biosynthesis protein A
MQVRGAILAGGHATRFAGKPKGLEFVGDRRILDLVAEALLTGLGMDPILVANVPEAGTWRSDLRVVSDVQPGLGALGGLYTAVVSAPAPVVCVAWDMPFVTSALVSRLAEGLEGSDVYLPASGSRRGVEPLCAAYGPACRAAIERAIADGDSRAIGFHRRVRVGILSEADVSTLGDARRLFFNVNTEHDLARAQELI